LSSRCFEIIRSIQSSLARLSPAVRACAQSAFCIPVPHQQAQSFIQNLRGSKNAVPICHNFFFPENRMNALHTTRPTTSALRPLRAFAAGNLEGRKGIAIALQAIFLAKKAGVRVQYRVTSQGPELAHLQRLSKRLQLTDQVILGERFDAADFAAALATFDIVLLPSLRDGAGLSIMEAMLAGCVPIVADWCGPAEFVTPDCGYKVAVTDPIKMATEIAHILSILDADRSLLRVKGDAALTRIRSSYSEAQFLESMNKFFVSAVSAVPLAA
jgi:glycosyltransferase involved in cell wall biosynthesis